MLRRVGEEGAENEAAENLRYLHYSLNKQLVNEVFPGGEGEGNYQSMDVRYFPITSRGFVVSQHVANRDR